MESNEIWVIFNLAELDRVVVCPFAQSVVPKESVEKLTRFEVGVLLANVSDENGPGHSTTVSQHI